MKDMGRIKELIDQQLAEVQKSIDNSTFSDWRKKLDAAVEKARLEIDHGLSQFGALNAKADPVADGWLDRLKHSRYSMLIVFAIAAGLVGLGVFVGAVVKSWFC